MRILVIEDSDADALRMRRSLERSMEDPPTFARALDLAEGVRRCRDEDFDVVLLDLYLPDSAGVDTVRRFIAERFDPQPAVVVLTAEGDETVATQSLRFGAEDYLVKGEFGPRPAHRVLRHSLERHRMAVESGADGRATARLVAELEGPVRRMREELAALAGSADEGPLAEGLRRLERDVLRLSEVLDGRSKRPSAGSS